MKSQNSKQDSQNPKSQLNPWKLSPSTQNVIEGIKHATLNPCIHLAMFVASFTFAEGMNTDEFAPTIENGDNELSSCENLVNDYRSLVLYFQYLHIFAFIVQTMDLFAKGPAAISENMFCGPRLAGMISILNIIVIVDYHSILAILLKRFNQYGDSVEICNQ